MTIKKKSLYIATFVIIGVSLVILFITSTTYIQLSIAAFLYPPFVYFVLKTFPFKTLKQQPVYLKQPIAVVKPVENNKDHLEVVDIDKRAFLKLIGAAGFSFFLFSIFTRKIEALLLGKATESGVALLDNKQGSLVPSPEPSPTDGYKISEIDNSEFTYYGFIRKDGGWYIMKEDPSSGSFRYVKGESNFPKNWNNRDSLKYDYFDNVFS